MDADPGLFGPDSVTWRVHGDPMMWVAGLRALYLQALHPRAMWGVYQNSDFKTDPWGRLMRTADYVGVVTYGTGERVDRAATHLRRLHSRLRGHDPDTDESYRLDEPDLLRWVHCCEADSFLTTMCRAGMRLTDEEADQYVAEQRTSATLVGLDAEDVPGDVEELRTYFETVRPELRTTREARRAAFFVLAPPMPPLVSVSPARPAWAAVASLAFALMPRWARRMYGAPGLPTTDLTATVSAAAMRRSLTVLPPSLRDGPHLKGAKRRLQEPAGSGGG
ncbi:MAG: oxygenase MpaB family protein [Streptosporangiaceae bacterium]